ncbi:MAG: hypothetical protein MZV70_41480 [Desulfobacterales bacterium]|nr:hypothetical protein [Desulfobacterales bacterium]
MSAEYLGGFAITEPDAGSDVMAMRVRRPRTRATTGCSTAPRPGSPTPTCADVLIYYAYTDRSKAIAGAVGLRAGDQELQRGQDVAAGEDGLALLADGRGLSGRTAERAQGEHPGRAGRRGQDRLQLAQRRRGFRPRRAPWGWPRPAWTRRDQVRQRPQAVRQEDRRRSR